MIKVGIIGGESQIAGELLRLLVLHPEVELTTVFSPELRGTAVNSQHRGMTGEINMRFTDVISYDNLDVVFITNPHIPIPSPFPEDLKVIYFTEGGAMVPESLNQLELVPGVSEMFRKPLVRGAKASKILSSATTVSLIALFPLALHLMLNNSLKLTVKLPLYKKEDSDKERIKKELEELLHYAQLSFSNIEEIRLEKSNLLRTIAVEAELDCNIVEEEIERIYDETYDDHNFTFMMRNDPANTEVAGTQKCLIYISKPNEETLRIKAIADSFLRGGAGDAIHAMNLLFGLYEKTGLAFPASMAFKHDEIKPEEM